MPLRTTLVAASMLLSTAALADDVCVQIDEKADTLEESDRRGALAVARAALAKAGETVIDSPCPNQYVITNSKLGETIFVTVRGPTGQRDAKAVKVDELGDLYQQMIGSLVKGVPMGEAVTRHNVTSRQERPKRVRAESVYYFALGPGYVLGVAPSSVPIHLAGGYRYELDQFALEVGAGLTFSTNSDEDSDTAVSGQLGLGGYWFADEEANSTPYFGVGLAFGGTALDEPEKTYTGAGLHGQISAGYEMLRASTIRAFLQFDVVLPMYALEHTTLLESATDETRYAPIFLLKVGIGWAPSYSSGFRSW